MKRSSELNDNLLRAPLNDQDDDEVYQTESQLTNRGIDDKRVFFVQRTPNAVTGSYFEYKTEKVICNPSEVFHFYLKIGAITYLPRKEVPGKKISTSAERIKDSKYYGSYLYYGQSDQKIRCILYAKRKLLPEEKLISQPSCLNSVIPRYCGQRRGTVVVGMKVVESVSSDRLWSRYDNKTNIRRNHPGFWEITGTTDLRNIFAILPNARFGRTPTGPDTLLYIGANTSLIMVDTARAHLYLDYAREFVYTLFQEGGVVCFNRKFTYSFYDEEESEEYDAYRLFEEKFNKMKGTPNLERLLPIPDQDNRKVIFLKSGHNHTLWTLRVNKYRRAREMDVMLCIPSGGQFELIHNWEDGIREVNRRHVMQPWRKYIQEAKSTSMISRANGNLSKIDLSSKEPYPKQTFFTR